MASRLIQCIAAGVLSVALPTMATAQTAKQCLTPKEAQGLVSFALPDVITSISTKCAPSLGPDSYLSRSGTDLAGRYRVVADTSWPSAKLAVRKFMDADATFLNSLPDDVLKGILTAGISTAIVKDVKTTQCGNINRIVQVLAPLPAENMSQLVGIVLELSSRPPAQAAVAKTKAPFSICPPAGGTGKPVTTK
jgi:hypothetical protein